MTVLVPRHRILRPQLSIPRLNFRRLGDPVFNRLGIRGQPWGCGGLFPRVAAPAGIEDDFSGDLSKWTSEIGTWSISSGVLQLDNADGARSYIRYTDLSTTNEDQYAMVEITTLGGGGQSLGLAFRAEATGNLYILIKEGANVEWWVMSDGGGWVESIQSAAQAIIAGDDLAAEIKGTGDSTVCRIWINPTGTNPTAWGAEDHNFTNNPSNPVNSGNEVGVLGQANAAPKPQFDNFYGGDA